MLLFIKRQTDKNGAQWPFLRPEGVWLYSERAKKEQNNAKKAYTPKPYDTPTRLGVKWQMDVKIVPRDCYVGATPDKFCQYTVLDEASRERFIFPYLEHSSHSSMDFLQKAIAYFGYAPAIIQTDNGG